MTSLFQSAESWEDQSLLEIILLTQLYYKEKHWNQLYVCKYRKPTLLTVTPGLFSWLWLFSFFTSSRIQCTAWGTCSCGQHSRFTAEILIKICVLLIGSQATVLSQKTHTHTWTISRALANSGSIGFFRASNTTVIPTSFISFLKNIWLTLKLLADIPLY